VSAASFFSRASDARSISPIGFIGEFIRSHEFVSITGVNQHPQAAQVTTITIPAGPANSTAYSVIANGVVTASFTTDAAATQDELGDGLAAAWNAKPGCYNLMHATYTGGVLTLTGVWPGVVVAVTRSGGAGGTALGAPTDSTSAASAEVVEFGLVCVSDGVATDEDVPKVYVPTTADFTAQRISLTFAGDAASYYHGTVQINGRTYPWGGVVWDTNVDTTCTAIMNAINAVMPAETVIAASTGGSTGIVTLTAEVEGAEFDADAHAQGHASAECTKAYTTGPSVATSLLRSMVGITVRRLDVENQTAGGDDPAYSANEGVEVARKGYGIVQRDTTETWVRGDECYISLAAATKGRIYDTASTDRVWLPPSRLVIDRSEHSTTSDGLGVIRLDMGA